MSRGVGEEPRTANTSLIHVIELPQSAVRPVRVGVTGHTDLGGATSGLVARVLREQLRALRADPDGRNGREPLPLVGVSCLAPGADCLFADVVLGLGPGCTLEVVLPSDDYGDWRRPQLDRFDALLHAAGTVRRTGWAQAGPEAYAAANELMLDAVDHLVAVWDGVHSPEPGSTAHAVTRAGARRLPVTVLWPEGARRG